ncbi:type VII secretion protein EccB [Corynebacterium cystitidis]|uniref:type VII secretion protein EccB n=1 Tax=Corynebacterium cystitidis TaxID=35757 RepID=UPI00211EE655|nr:type VII secretion protein EccB [Corynebacterium cystitidis]
MTNLSDSASLHGDRTFLPTTKAQVSGHRFLRRRVEHGLLYGDIRMIHDPLTARRRAAILGVVAVVLIGAVAGLLAWLKPNAQPGDSPIVRASSGALFVRIDDSLHPVTNVTSARLIVGEPAEPASIGDGHLAESRLGVPVGIVAAPTVFAPEDAADVAWSACTDSGDSSVTVVAGPAPSALQDGEAVVATDGEREWLLTAQGRALLPQDSSPQARAVRRGLGVSPDTPRWQPPSEVLEAVRETAPITVPTPVPEVMHVEGEQWLLQPSGGVQKITAAQAHVLEGAGAEARKLTREELAAFADATEPTVLTLPEKVPTLLDPAAMTICATERGGVGVFPFGHMVPGAVELSGSSVATQFRGLSSGAIGVDTGHSFHVVSGAGVRHAVESPEVLSVVGASRVDEAPWAILRLLPEGPDLTQERASRATY